MKKLAALFLALGLLLGTASQAHAERVYVGVGVGYGGYPGYYHGYYGYPGYYPYGYPAYYPGYYAAPPPVVYSPYAPAPTVAYVAPPPVIAATPTLGANQTSPTFTDAEGRTCRQFQTTNGVGPAGGTACLMPDGSWRSVP